jgi:hypothetical protein
MDMGKVTKAYTLPDSSEGRILETNAMGYVGRMFNTNGTVYETKVRDCWKVEIDCYVSKDKAEAIAAALRLIL